MSAVGPAMVATSTARFFDGDSVGLRATWRIGKVVVRPDRRRAASPDLHDEFVAAVIGAMDASEDLSAQILNNPELSQKSLGELVPLIYRELKAAG